MNIFGGILIQPTLVVKGSRGLSAPWCPQAPLATSPSLYLLDLEGQRLCWTMGTKVTALVELEGRGLQQSGPITSGMWVGGQSGKLRAQD